MFFETRAVALIMSMVTFTFSKLAFFGRVSSSSQTYCENNISIDGGGWAMVWKHSYNQVDKSQLSRMRTYSQEFMPCVNMSVGWCNLPNKQPTGYREQMLAAYHNGILVYAYKAPLNPNLGKSKTGPYLNVTRMIVDRCTANRGTRPSLYFRNGSYDLLFDKYSPTSYTANCDTMRGAYWSDCRWENCQLPSSVSVRRHHTQMTMFIYVR